MPTLMRRGPASANPSSGHDDGPPHPSPSDLRRRRSNDGGDGDGDATNHRQHRNLDSDLELELDHRLSNRHRRGGPADREGRRTRTRTRTAPTVGAGRGGRNRRVVLLLDLDCFYAQCECVRLGIDSSSVPVVLLQWNSCLAVNYPARAYGIKRGDSFEAVREKSGGRCAALHLPVIPVSGGGRGGSGGGGVKSAASVAGNGGDDGEEADDKDEGAASSSLDESYAQEYRLPPAVRSSLLLREKNVMRRPSEGKASLERYRVASAMIFRTATEALREHLGRDGFVLERASIDELFLDVSDHCYDESRVAWKEEGAAMKSSENNRGDGDGEGDFRIGGGCGGVDTGSSSGPEPASKADETVVCGASRSFRLDDDDDREDDEDDEDVRALRRGCAVALGVRRAVYDRLGFTLSAGVSVNKMMAKLAAGYGKPNGQAVIFPEAISEVLKDTEIRKVRHFGGKAGKKLLELLPPGETKMGSVAKLLSLNRLVEALGGRDAARHAFDASRGVDNEEVTETKGALTKSITAFKSFRATTLDGLGRWMALLATDVCERVELDSKRNSRYPKNCNIQYVYVDGRGNRVTRSLRVPFPSNKSGGAPSSSLPRAEELVRRVTDALRKRGGKSPMNRLGLSAVDFETRATSGSGGIESFFRAGDGRSSDRSAGGGGKEKCAADDSTDREKDDSGVDDGAVGRSRRRLDVAKNRSDGEVKAAPKRRSAPAPSKSGCGDSSSRPKEEIVDKPTGEEGCAAATSAAEDAAAAAAEDSPTDTTSSNDQRHEQQCHDDMELARRMQERFDKEKEEEEAQRQESPPTAASGGSSESPSLAAVPSIAAAADEGVSSGADAEEDSGPLRCNPRVCLNDEEGEESSSVDADPVVVPLESRRQFLDEVQEGSSRAERERGTTAPKKHSAAAPPSSRSSSSQMCGEPPPPRHAEASGEKDEDANDSILTTDDDRQYRDDMELARRMQEKFDKEDKGRRRSPQQAAAIGSPSGAAGRDGGINAAALLLVHPETASSSSDLDYATKLQALYDRENTVLSAHDGRRCRVAATPPTKRAFSAATGHRPPRWNSPKKKNRIENFFSRKYIGRLLRRWYYVVGPQWLVLYVLHTHK